MSGTSVAVLLWIVAGICLYSVEPFNSIGWWQSIAPYLAAILVLAGGILLLYDSEKSPERSVDNDQC
jgi:hypothetical protein